MLYPIATHRNCLLFSHNLVSVSSSSALAVSLNSLKSAAVAAHASVLAPGQSAGRRLQALVDFLSMEAEEQKRQVCGSLVECSTTAR